MKDVERHYADVLALGQSLGAETIKVEEASGRVLAKDIQTRLAVPPFTNSAMDGFAVRAADVEPGKEMAVVDDIAAGRTDIPTLPKGKTIRIMTGAPMPHGSDSVIQVELTENSEGNMAHQAPASVIFTKSAEPGANVRKAGEDVLPGEKLVAKGTRLGPSHLSALVSVGYGEIPVVKRPVVGVVTTGEELKNAGEPLSDGQIPDSNIVLLSALVAQAGGIAKPLAYHSDNVEEFGARLAELASQVDMIVTAGGVSMGAFDVVKESLGEVEFCKVKMQPGKPQGFGKLGGKPVLCLPGNPVSVMVSWYLFGNPLLTKLAGRGELCYQELFSAHQAGVEWRRKPGRVQFMPVIERDGLVVPASHGGSKSHFVATTFAATGIARVPAEQDVVAAGEEISVLWFGENR